MIIPLKDIDINSLLEFYFKIEPFIPWTEYGAKGKQAGIQYKIGDNQWNSAVGKHNDDDLNYSHLNSFFKNSEFENIINEFNLKRSRLMWLNPYSCYSMHRDQTPRLHIPLITNPDCYFIFKQEPPINLIAGKIYRAETRLSHTFINCSEMPRLHFIGILEN